jgi:hypothetical protein
LQGYFDQTKTNEKRQFFVRNTLQNRGQKWASGHFRGLQSRVPRFGQNASAQPLGYSLLRSGRGSAAGANGGVYARQFSAMAGKMDEGAKLQNHEPWATLLPLECTFLFCYGPKNKRSNQRIPGWKSLCHATGKVNA